MAWASMRDRLHRLSVRTFNDGLAQFRGQKAAGAPVDVPVMIDRNLQYESDEGRFLTQAVGFTWLKKDLRSAARGDIFVIGCERFQVDQLIADDGHVLTAATTKL